MNTENYQKKTSLDFHDIFSREHQQKTLFTLSRFWLLRWGCVSESVKKGKLVMKIFFLDNVE